MDITNKCLLFINLYYYTVTKNLNRLYQVSLFIFHYDQGRHIRMHTCKIGIQRLNIILTNFECKDKYN